MGFRPLSRIFSLKFFLPGVFICGLLGLGFWQLSRYEEVSVIQKQFQATLNRPPTEFETLKTYTDFQPVIVRGEYLHYFEISLLAKTHQGRAGVVILTPLKLANGQIIAINRGWTPSPKGIQKPRGPVEVKGVLRNYLKDTGWFTPPNSKGAWHTMNYADLKSFWRHDLLPVYIAVDAPQDGLYPHLLTNLGKNDPQKHIHYALTWFALALALTIMTFFFLRKS